MSFNREILMKLKDQTKDEKDIQDFLMDILQFESERKGWYEKDYNRILKDHMTEEKSDEV